jgi:hypothetical protein
MLRALQPGSVGILVRVIFEESNDLAIAEPFNKAGPDRKGWREFLNLLLQAVELIQLDRWLLGGVERGQRMGI